MLGRRLAERLEPAQLEQAMAEALDRWEREQWPIPDWEPDPRWVCHHGCRDAAPGERLVLQGAGVGEGIDPATFEPALEQQLLRWEVRG